MLNARRELLKEAVDTAFKRMEYYVSRPLNKGGGTGGDQGRYGAVVLNELGELLSKDQQHPCHAFMKNYHNPVVVFTQYSHRHGSIKPEADKLYFDWITSDTGPWKSFKNRSVSETPDGSGKDWIFKNGWVWTDLDVPANLQHNFLIASRIVSEWPSEINRWYKFVHGYGCHPALAFLFLTVFTSGQKGYYQISHSNKYDWPVDICTAGGDYVQNFCSGKVENLIQNYSQSPSYKPVNRIFGVNNLSGDNPKAYPNVIFDRYYQKIGPTEKEITAIWGNNFGLSGKMDPKRHWLVSESDIVKIIKEETERLHV